MGAIECRKHGLNCIVLVSPDVHQRAQEGLPVRALERVPYGIPTFVSPDFASEHGFLNRLRVPVDQELTRSYMLGDPSLRAEWRDLVGSTPMCESCLREAYQCDLEADFDFPPRGEP